MSWITEAGIIALVLVILALLIPLIINYTREKFS